MKCPKCNYVIDGLECLHCGYKWVARVVRRPKVCPSCKSYNWDKKPQKKFQKKKEV